MTAGMGGKGGDSPPWGKTAPRTPPINQQQPSVGADTLGAAMSHLQREHPHHVQGENLQMKTNPGIHHPVGRPGNIYKGTMNRHEMNKD